MPDKTAIADDNVDDNVDDEIGACLSLQNPSSFFVSAGAGSGKTRSLGKAIALFVKRHRSFLRLHGKFLCVITYTNAAVEEIRRRVEFDSIIKVSTIHSFAWEMIRGFDSNIKEWIRGKLQSDLAELADEQSRAKSPTNKASIDRAKKIASKTKRLNSLSQVRRFTYNPSGDNAGLDSLAHSEVVEIAAYFLTHEPIMQQILVQRFPFLFIDESQDTNAKLLDALVEVQRKHANVFALGLFGDTMQRIYNDGKTDLGKDLPSSWKTPVKRMNHRCPSRIVDLINKVRMATDNQKQQPRSDRGPGFVRLFALPGGITDKPAVEARIARFMAEITDDVEWRGPDTAVKRLILEHHMAAGRMGFTNLFQPLYEVDKLKTGLLDGTLEGISFFSRYIFPLVEAHKASDEFAIASLVRRYSPLLEKKSLRGLGESQANNLKKAREAVVDLCVVCTGDDPTFGEILLSVASSGLFVIPECFRFFTSRTAEEREAIATQAVSEGVGKSEEEESATLEATNAWEKFLGVGFSQLKPYLSYVSGNAGFGTHQGVKGLEFPRVMVIMDDSEARGWQFSYERLFGAKAKSPSSKPSDDPHRTTRLFYVTCSRAEKSLALIAYSENPVVIRAQVIRDGWFEGGEVVMMENIPD